MFQKRADHIYFPAQVWNEIVHLCDWLYTRLTGSQFIVVTSQLTLRIENTHFIYSTVVSSTIMWQKTLKWNFEFQNMCTWLNIATELSLLVHRASCRFTKYHTTNKCTNCMSFILNHFFKTLFTAPTCFDSISLIIIREH